MVNSDSGNLFVCYYMFDMLMTSKKSIARKEINTLITCLSDYYVTFALDYLTENPCYNNLWLEEILTDSSLNAIISKNKQKYIKAYFDECSYVGSIINLYNSASSSKNDKEFIKEYLNEIIKDDSKKSLELARCQANSKIIIILPKVIEDIIIKHQNSSEIYSLMKLSKYNKKRLLRELGNLKDKSLGNKQIFLKAIVDYAPDALAKVQIGDFVGEVKSSNIDANSGENMMLKVYKAVISNSDEVNKQTNNMHDKRENDKTFTIDDIEPPMPAYRYSDGYSTDFEKKSTAYIAKK